MTNDYNVRDTVGIRIAKVDRTNTSKKLLPCKILEKTNDRYRIYSVTGILNTTFSYSDLIDLRNVRFEDLETIAPPKLERISFTKASRDVSGFENPSKVGTSVCNCKGDCSNNRCRKNDIKCSTKCHPDVPTCLNK